MLIHDVSDERLEEMKMRLLMEGIFNRDRDAVTWAEKMKAVFENFRGDFFEGERLARTHGAEDEEKRFNAAYLLCGSVLDELDQVIKERS